tara:strand:+ start:214 stop:471 length:258 start_codon:yes stop_codon:yes gene_type:complete
MTEDKKELEILLTTYIALKKNQAQCAAFIDGFEAAIEYRRKGQSLPIDSVSNRRELLIEFKSWEISNDIKNLTIEQTIDFFIDSN